MNPIDNDYVIGCTWGWAEEWLLALFPFSLQLDLYRVVLFYRDDYEMR
jgi:hypothetical protein